MEEITVDQMIEILWHGRGGQGAFTAAKLLGAAYSAKDGNYSIAFPSFGPERRGAPVRAFTKLDSRRIGDRSEIEKADYVIYLDDTLFSDSFDELKENGKIIINTKKHFDDKRIIAADADAMANEIIGRPITNTVMLGVLAGVSKITDYENIAEAIRGYMPEKLHEKNIKAAAAAFESVSGVSK